ncbi:methylase involved in ubiquinone/menaquinone biosynthesis [Sphingomonas sp. MM-1]|uniref:class I SAM-dependent methyltransferase n=1 Tax=Sphingomonas sp. MM-1 TaxID=745310 RepID=UPI0002C0C059|nr:MULTISPECIES: class I SAM-dependent methyltransferase [unclassified Sphingomonas]AGH47819.1 methylase involved in ubiquinone/menaquinone biosynthesis [Sphingomonas sp. MM-1]MDX3882932.1 class I SAM-dependent methyltransferase [Sphingomonas sp.]
MKQDVPPPYTAVARHAVFPAPRHDEAARYNFLTGLNKYLSGTIGAGNKLAYDTRVLPAFRAEHGRDPRDRFEIRHAMNRDPWHRFWSACKRNSMEMRQQNGRSITLRQIDELAGKVRQFNEGRDTLELDPAVKVPRYQDAVDIHCMPGCYHGEERPGDMSAGANYDSGLFATTGGGLGALSDGGGQALVEWIRKERPGWTPKRILDLGCTVGHNIVPLALAFPEAEVIAIDTAAPVLRYGHARAQALGATNLRFIQMDAEHMGRFADGHFDWVQTTMYLHELSGKALPAIIREGVRVLAPGGLMFHLEQPQYTDDMPLYEQFIRDWDAFNNNEPFWSAMHAMDLKQIMADAGLPLDCQFVTGVRAVVDRDIFPQAPSGEQEDHGRAAVWNAYGAWKPKA